MAWQDLTPGILALFAEAQGDVQRSRVTAWESARRRVRPTKGEVMATSLKKQAEVFAAIARGLEGLSPAAAREVVDVLPMMTPQVFGALASISRDLEPIGLGSDDVRTVAEWVMETIEATTPPPPAKVKGRSRAATARKGSGPGAEGGPGRPMGEESQARVAFIVERGTVSIDTFAARFGVDHDRALNWLKSAHLRRGWIAKGERGEYVSLAEAARRKAAA